MAHAVVVVGAGVAGMGAALALRERGITPLLLEAEDRAGGKLGTESQRGFLLERAALGLLDRSGELAELCAKLGIAPYPASPAASLRFVERGGTVHALPRGFGEALTTKLLSAREKVALLGEPFRPAAPDGGTVAEFFAHRLGSGGRFLGDAIQTGIHAGDPDRLELRTAFPTLAALAEAGRGSLIRGALAGSKRKQKKPRARLASFRGGMQELVDALSRRTLPKLRARVRAVRSAGRGYRLQVETGGTASEIDAERVVLALPAPGAAEVLDGLDAPLAGRLRELNAAAVSLVHLAVAPQDVAPLHQGFGLLRPGRPVLGALFPAALWPERAPGGQALLSALVGGARHPQAASLPDEELVQLVRNELRLPRPPELLRVVRWAQAIPQYEPGHGARVAEIERLTAGHPGLRLTGAWYRGVGVLDCLRDGRKVAESLGD
ncbi:MAG: protoporphyrinogen oxidase [Deltaproteobacteria bacterium]|nr:MAG: protoporphyrinogen oxidase [Deltaproteobacteria bacterium]